MTDRASPGAKGSIIRNVEMGEIYGTLGWNKVIEASDPSRSAQNDSDIDETAFNEFAATYSSTSLTVTIDPGEAFVDGWVARDVSTDVTLDASTSGQTVYVGWDHTAIYDSSTHTTRDEADTAIIGLESDFNALDPKLELWTFDTDADGVTNAVDERNYLRPLGGVSFLDNQEPDYEEGLNWYNPDTGDYHVSHSNQWEVVNKHPPAYGDGSDGTITRSTDGEENGVLFPQTYTLESGVTRQVTSGILIIVAKEKITINGTIDGRGTIVGGGGAGGSSSSTSAGDGGDGGGRGATVLLAAPEIDVSGATLDLRGEDGQNGGDGTSGDPVGLDGSPGNPGANAIAVNGGGGGNGGIRGGSGGSAGTTDYTNETHIRTINHPVLADLWDLKLPISSGGGGGGGGGQSSKGYGAGGGGGGGPGGFALIYTNHLTGSYTTDVTGGVGGLGGDDPSGGAEDGADGDNGAVIEVVYND